jgi:hypothetical protein
MERWTWLAMLGNGWPIGMTAPTIADPHREIPKVQNLEAVTCCGAAPGEASQGGLPLTTASELLPTQMMSLDFDAACLRRHNPRLTVRIGHTILAGNVREWCEDWYDEHREDKVLRGGSWLNYLSSARPAIRIWYLPGNRNFSIGFRCLVLPTSSP